MTASATSKRIPYAPARRPLIGHLLDFGRDPLGFLERCGELSSDVVRLDIPARTTWLLNDARSVRQVLEEQHAVFEKTSSPADVGGVFGNGVFTSRKETWLRQRRLLQKAFRHDRIAAYAELALHHMRVRVGSWLPGAVDLHGFMESFVLEATPAALFGLNSERSRGMTNALAVLVERFRNEFPAPRAISSLLPRWVPTPGNRQLRRAIHDVRALATQALLARGERAKANPDVIDLLNAEMARQTACTMTEARDQVVTLLLTGHETTVAALTWMLWLVARHPQVQTCLADEIAAARKTGLRGETLLLLPYANCVVSESLRLMPPAWGMNRRCVSNTIIAECPVAAGHYVAFSQWVLHRSRRYFERPLAFIPERWKTIDATSRAAFFPFGAGPRRCLGERLALAHMLAALATVVESFELYADPRAEPRKSVSITVNPDGPVYIEARRRRPAP